MLQLLAALKYRTPLLFFFSKAKVLLEKRAVGIASQCPKQ
jgi:hypothetical protein